MNTNNSPFGKRKNPFATTSNGPVVPESTQETTDNNNFYDEEDEIDEIKETLKPQIKQQTIKRPVRQTNRQQYYPVDDANREKYTSTMDISLRRQIKIVCATRGIMFAKFVEDACREKLEREGVR